MVVCLRLHCVAWRCFLDDIGFTVQLQPHAAPDVNNIRNSYLSDVE